MGGDSRDSDDMPEIQTNLTYLTRLDIGGYHRGLTWLDLYAGIFTAPIRHLTISEKSLG